MQDPTHLGRVLAELGIGYIRARSPQAKGRIERLWRTLQDRLRAELRLRGIVTLAAANAFLPAVPRRLQPALRPPARRTRRPRGAARPAISPSCSAVAIRGRVARDNTVRLGPRWLQLPPGPRGRSWAGSRVELRECLDGRLVALANGRALATLPSPGPDFVLAPRAKPGKMRAQRLRASGARRRRGAAISPLPTIARLRRARRWPPWPRTSAARPTRTPGGGRSRGAPVPLTPRSPLHGGMTFSCCSDSVRRLSTSAGSRAGDGPPPSGEGC